MMKAIVLSCDKYHKIANHMVHTYQKLWPSNPFIFVIPYNDIYPQFIKDKWKDKVELVKTSIKFKQTINNLLKNIDDEEWIYWATDDRYVIDIDENVATNTYEFIKTLDKSIYTVCLYNGQYDRDYRIADKSDCLEYNGYKFFRKTKITYQWHHQFCRSKVIKKMFDCIDEPLSAKQMDRLLKTEKAKSFWELTNEGKWYMVENNSIIMGESTSRGDITSNCEESFKEYGLSIPSDFEISPHSIIKT